MNAEIRVERHGVNLERVEVQTGEPKRLILTLPDGSVIRIECFIRDGCRGFYVKPDGESMLLLSPAGNGIEVSVDV